MPEWSLEDLIAQIAEVRVELEELKTGLSLWSPVHIGKVESLEFRFDSIDIKELSGQLNIGFTHMEKASGQKKEKPVKNFVEDLATKLAKEMGHKLKGELTAELKSGLKPELVQALSSIFSRVLQPAGTTEQEKELLTELERQLEKTLEQKLGDIVEQALEQALEQKLTQELNRQIQEVTQLEQELGADSDPNINVKPLQDVALEVVNQIRHEVEDKVRRALRELMESTSTAPSGVVEA